MTNKELLEQSEKLAKAWESMKVSVDSLSMTIALTREDKAWGKYYFDSRLADNLEDNLLNISKTMLAGQMLFVLENRWCRDGRIFFVICGT